MPHIQLPDDLPGIRGAMAFRPETAKPLNELVEVLLRGPNTLTPGERELIATYVSSENDCYYCQTIHGAIAAASLDDDEGLVKKVKQDFQHAAISDKLKALLVIAGQVQKGGKNVTAADVARAREAGATDLEIHDTVLIAAAFCMYNRYVDGLGTWQPRDEAMYRERGKRIARDGYVAVSKRVPAARGGNAVTRATMAHISLPEGLPGISGCLAFRPETAKPLRELAHVLLHAPGSLTPGARELIATYVSSQNDCFFCQSIHGAVAAAHPGQDAALVDQVKRDFWGAAISDKLKALLVIAGKVQKGGKQVTAADVEGARAAGATDKEIHDTVLIAAAFCMYNRYVDGLDTWQPNDPGMYGRHGGTPGYAWISPRHPYNLLSPQRRTRATSAPQGTGALTGGPSRQPRPSLEERRRREPGFVLRNS